MQENEATLQTRDLSKLSTRLYLCIDVRKLTQTERDLCTQNFIEYKLSERLIAQNEALEATPPQDFSLWYLESDKQAAAISEQIYLLIKRLADHLTSLPPILLLSTVFGEAHLSGDENLRGLSSWFSLLEKNEVLADQGVSDFLNLFENTRAFHLLDHIRVHRPQYLKPLNCFIFSYQPSVHQQSDLPFYQRCIGRNVERAYIESILRELNSASPMMHPVIEISGSAGMGKSTFLASLIPLIERRNLTLLRTLCVDFLSADVESSIAQICHSLLQICKSEICTSKNVEHEHSSKNIEAKEVRETLLECQDLDYLPKDEAIFPLLSLLGAPLLPEEQSALSLFLRPALISQQSELICYWLRALSRKRGVCLVIEDGHWIDDELTQLLHALLTSPDLQSRLLILITARPDSSLSSKLPQLKKVSKRIELKPLSPSESREFAHELTLSKRLPWQVNSHDFADADWIERCVIESEGFPLLLTHLLSQAPSKKFQSAQTHSLQELFLERFKKLSTEAQTLLKLASCIGRIFNPKRLSTNLKTLEALKETSDAQFIEAEGELWQFKHALIRDSIYADLSPEERKSSHLEIAAAYPDHHSLRAEHLSLASDPRALNAYLLAGEDKEQEYQAHAALSLYERALRLHLTSDERIEVLSRQGWIFEQLGDGRSCSRYFDEAYSLYMTSTEDLSARLPDLLLGRLAAQRLLGELEQADLSLTELSKVIDQQRMVLPLFRARVSYYQGCIAFSRGDLTRCYESHIEAISYIERMHSIGHQRALLTYAQAWSGCGDALYAQGLFHEAKYAMSRAVEIAREHRFGRIEVSTLHMLAIVTTYLGNASEGLHLASQCHQLAMNVNDARATLFAELNMALPMLWAGQAKEALIYCQHAAQRVERMESSILLGMSKAFLAHTLWWGGEYERALDSSELALHISSQQGAALFGGVALGAALLCQDTTVQQQQEWLDQGLDLLAQDVVSHNYLYFSLGASQILFKLRDRQRLSRLITALERFFLAERTESQTRGDCLCVNYLILWLHELHKLLTLEHKLALNIECFSALLELTSQWGESGLNLFHQMALSLRDREQK